MVNTGTKRHVTEVSGGACYVCIVHLVRKASGIRDVIRTNREGSEGQVVKTKVIQHTKSSLKF